MTSWGVLLTYGLVGSAWAAPKPSITPKSWQVDIAFHDPQRISVLHPGDAQPTVYWYVLFTVTNHSDRDVPFYPTFDIVTDDLSVIEGGDAISPTVYDAIAARHRKGYPFFVNPSELYGTLLRGEDNARVSAIAFRRPDPKVNRFTLYIAGLSGEIVRARNLGYNKRLGRREGNQPYFTMRKTLAVTYTIPGDPLTRLSAEPVRVKQEWVLR